MRLQTLRDSRLRGNLVQATCAHGARAGAAHRLNAANAGLASGLGEVYSCQGELKERVTSSTRDTHRECWKPSPAWG